MFLFLLFRFLDGLWHDQRLGLFAFHGEDLLRDNEWSLLFLRFFFDFWGDLFRRSFFDRSGEGGCYFLFGSSLFLGRLNDLYFFFWHRYGAFLFGDFLFRSLFGSGCLFDFFIRHVG